jgi:hypothetical protein
LLKALNDPVTMKRLEREDLQDQHVECALKERGFARGAAGMPRHSRY